MEKRCLAVFFLVAVVSCLFYNLSFGNKNKLEINLIKSNKKALGIDKIKIIFG